MIAILYIRPENVLAKILNSRPFSWIGVLSYSLYLWQQPMTDMRIAAWWGIPALFGIAWISYRYIERPFLVLKETLRRDTSPAAGPFEPARGLL